jgi:hypothetical protein
MTLYFPADVVRRIREVGVARRMAYSALVEEYVADGLARDEKRLRAAETGSGDSDGQS